MPSIKKECENLGVPKQKVIIMSEFHLVEQEKPGGTPVTD